MSIPRIPKLFFQTSKDALEPYLIKMTKKMLGPDWKYLHFLDSDILTFLETHPLKEVPGAIDIFKKLKRGEHKADFFRYYFLYVKGGVFMDSDAMIYRPIDQIVKDYRFISVNSSAVPGSLFQGILGAEPRNPLIGKALQTFQGNLSALDSNYHLLCKELFTIYQENPEKEGYHLFQEIGDLEGDRIVDSGELLFRHFWRNKEGIPCTLKSRNLIYCCVFYNKDYFKLLELLLKSMKMYSTLDSFDFLVMTSPEFAPLVRNLGRTLGLDLKIFTQEFSTIFQAACARLFIFDYPDIQGYEKILYLDTDIIIKSDLAPIFDLPIQELLYGIESGTIDSPSFGGQFFNFENSENDLSKIKRGTPGINSGTLLFLNSRTIQELFSRIRLHVDSFTREGNQPPYCMDQPFINFHAIKDSLYDNSLLNPLVSLYEGNDAVLNYETSSICHFSFPIGNFGHKYSRMCEFLEKTLTQKFQNSLTLENLVGKKFTWNSGFIKFVIDYKGSFIIETSWGNGTFGTLNNQSTVVTWSGHSHVVKFNEDFSEFTSIRTAPRDFEFVEGRLIESNLIIYGDSHGGALFRDLRLAHRNLFCFGKTMFSQGRNRWIHNFNCSQLSRDTIYCLTFGEVDVRAHIGKQVHLGRHHVDVCRDLVESFISALQLHLTVYRAIVIVAVPPPVDPEEHTHGIHNPPLPFIGSNTDRVIFTRDLNQIMESACKQKGYYFFNPFEPYKRENGMLNYELSDSCIHIGKNQHILSEFEKLHRQILTEPLT